MNKKISALKVGLILGSTFLIVFLLSFIPLIVGKLTGILADFIADMSGNRELVFIKFMDSLSSILGKIRAFPPGLIIYLGISTFIRGFLIGSIFTWLYNKLR